MKQKVPANMFPTRLDGAMNLYSVVEKENKINLIVYNINPTTWNCLYPFFELNHKFTIDNYHFSNNDMTYGELIEEYTNKYKQIHEIENGFDKKRRETILLDEYLKTFNLKSAQIGSKLEPCYELKYSKSKNVWTLYYFENYVLSNVDDINTLINQKVYSQEFLSLDKNVKRINGVDIVSNLPYILSIKENIKELENNKINLDHYKN